MEKQEVRRIQATETNVDGSLRETKKHGTEGFPLAVYLDDFTNFKNGYICWHWHEEVQITLILEGEFYCQVEKEEVRLQAGEAIFVNSGLLHQIRPVRLSEGKLYSFIFKASVLGGSETSDIYQKSVAPILRRNIPFVHMDSRDAVWQLTQIAGLYIEKGPHYEMKICCLLQQLWLDMCQSLPQSEEVISMEKKRDDARIKLALQYMQEHFDENILLEDIARTAMISRSELCRCFQRTLHVTPKEFLLQYRIRQATVMLQNPENRILDVAESTGFNSPSHFGVYFHKYMGCTPKEYRKLKNSNLSAHQFIHLPNQLPE